MIGNTAALTADLRELLIRAAKLLPPVKTALRILLLSTVLPDTSVFPRGKIISQMLLVLPIPTISEPQYKYTWATG